MRKLLLIAILTLNACGYTFQGGGSVLPADVKKIYIPVVENNSTQLGLGDLVTEALREQFDGYGVVTVVDRQGQADAVLNAKILRLKRETRSARSKVDTALQLETTIEMTAELVRVTGPVLWKDPSISVSRSFSSDSSAVVTSSADFASGSISSGDLSNLDTREVSRGQEQAAIEAIAEDAAREIYDQAVSPDF